MFQTLRSKLLVFFLLITFIPMLIIGTMGFFAQKNDITESVEHSLSMNSERMALEVKAFIQERLNDVRYIARNPIFTDEDSTSLEIREQFQQFLDVHSIYSGGIFVDTDGTVIADSDIGTMGSDIADRPWFPIALEGNVFMSDLYYSQFLHQTLFVLAAPVYNYNQDVIGVISPIFDIDELYRTIRDYNEKQQGSDSSGYAFLVNGEGQIISHPDQEQIFNYNYFEEYELEKQEIIEVATDQYLLTIEAENEVHSFSKIEKMPGFEHDWYIGVSVNKDELYEPLTKLLQQYVVVFGIVLVVTTMAVVRLSNYLVRPVQRLVKTTNDFALGKKQPREFINAYEEINQLNNTFNQMTEKLEERENSHKKSTLILQTTDNGVFAINRKDNKITLFNRKCEKLFSVDQGEIVGKTLQEIDHVSEAFNKVVAEAGLVHILGREAVKQSFEIECKLGDESKYFFISISTLPNLENPSEHDEMLVILSDLTEKRLMEKELIRSEKLKVVGEMSAGLAHEIRNPLTTIRGCIQLIDKNESKEDQYHQLIMNEIDRVNKIITDLLNIANPSPVEKLAETNIEDMLQDLLTLHQTQLNDRKIKVQQHFGKDLPKVVLDENKLKQVFLNLIQNAIEAMKGGGYLMIQTSYDDQIEIRIKDTGVGMDKHTLNKLGTPFFTTKETGTGLGLTISYKIINEMGGSITASSKLNEGTTFKIRLPVKR
ncbi:ATP-binding protein [Evansella halocellulosilytica]|uniref:ATP-binding protein n=1 Tax=Evansella halocellulosilytica TaxID=2011013 RepID=UPI000BB73489|nr:ATP-binding protein [Evansella halocellulosilytica]